jgi:phosphoribosylamine--glycine ligase
MRVLVVGGGGREHALVHSFTQSGAAARIFCAPGNAGTASEADNVPIAAEDLQGLLEFARREAVDLTVVGPEAPLVAGITDLFRQRGLAVFGPTREAARLEGSKAFAKDVMYDGGVPTGRYRRHESLETALECLALQESYPLVVKADGLAAGKGVIICEDFEQAKAAVEQCFVKRAFGDAGDVVMIEEFLRGAEVSLLVLCDGTTALPLAPAQDYKRIFAGDMGPNTGGMGSYCPVPGFERRAVDEAMARVVEPTIAALRKRGIEYRGVMYAGLIITDDGMKVLEFNCRFGDPETQAVLPRLRSDLLQLCAAAAAGELAGMSVKWTPQDCVTVVLASKG